MKKGETYVFAGLQPGIPTPHPQPPWFTPECERFFDVYMILDV